MPLTRVQIQSLIAFAALLSLAGVYETRNSWRQWLPGSLNTKNLDDFEWTPEREHEYQAHFEIAHEMMGVIFLREPKDPKVVHDFAMTLLQGASYEGIYNGFVHSAHYRGLEKLAAFKASPQGLDFFCQQIKEFRQVRGMPLEFNEWDPLPPPVVDPTEKGMLAAIPKVKKSHAPCKDLFSKSNLFTLKRFLADEALSLISEMDEVHRAVWYGKWASQMAASEHVGKRFDFGIPERNKPDSQFHEAWCRRVRVDLMRWEVLNRIHRVLNLYLLK